MQMRGVAMKWTERNIKIISPNGKVMRFTRAIVYRHLAIHTRMHVESGCESYGFRVVTHVKTAAALCSYGLTVRDSLGLQEVKEIV